MSTVAHLAVAWTAWQIGQICCMPIAAIATRPLINRAEAPR